MIRQSLRDRVQDRVDAFVAATPAGFAITIFAALVLVFTGTMFLGRIGTVTLAAALAASQGAQLYRRSEERPIVG